MDNPVVLIGIVLAVIVVKLIVFQMLGKKRKGDKNGEDNWSKGSHFFIQK